MSWWGDWSDFKVLITGLLGVMGIFMIFALFRLRGRRRFSADGVPSFEYSWIHLPLKNSPENHLPVHYRLEGDASLPTLVLIHGLGANINCWRRLIPELKNHFRILALDLPGFGLTPNPESFFGQSPDELSDLIIDLLDGLKIQEPVYMIGNSLGGLLTLALMERHPSRVRKTLLINPALSRKLVTLKLYRFLFMAGPIARVVNRSALAWMYSRTLSKPNDLEPEVLDHLAKNYIRNPQGLRNFAQYVRIIEEQGVPQVDYDNCLFLFSGGDRVVTAPHQKRIRRFFPHAKILFHPSGGHQLQEDEPQWLSEQTRSFFLSS